MTKQSNKYDANFTAGGILFNEFISLKEILLSRDFNELIAVESLENNLIGIATHSARKRIITEIKRRKDAVSINFWRQFFEWNEGDQKLALFYLCLKAYPLVFDIHFEVAINKFKVGGLLKAYDVQMRLDEISSNDDFVSTWSDSTFKKINGQYRKALKDVGLLEEDLLLTPRFTSTSYWDYFKNNNEAWFLEACFVPND